MKLLTFNEWLHNQPDDLKADECKKCEGYGFVESPISDRYDDCKSCGGTGNAHYKEYESQIEKDKILLRSVNIKIV